MHTIQIPSCFLRVLDHSRDCTSLYYIRPPPTPPPPQKKFCIIPSKLTLGDVSEVFIILQYPNLAIHLMQRGTSPTVLKAWLNISPPMEASI